MIFWKYQGLGNDFVLIENFDLSVPTDPEFVRKACDRRFGIGGDGILYLNPDKEAVAFMKIMNSDGSEAEMCGNGIRCVAKHLYDAGITDKKEMLINTLSGMKKVTCKVLSGKVKSVTVEMGAPALTCDRIPMNCEGKFIDEKIEAGGRTIKATAVSMGNPHLVIFDDVGEDMRTLGPLLEDHPLFPRKTNVEFVKVNDAGLEIAVYERGAGWTLACGTGACASTVAAALKGLVPFDRDVKVALPGGILTIKVAKDLSSVWMTGPAERVFEGNIDW